jgi:hypothetical protein
MDIDRIDSLVEEEEVEWSPPDPDYELMGIEAAGRKRAEEHDELVMRMHVYRSRTGQHQIFGEYMSYRGEGYSKVGLNFYKFGYNSWYMDKYVLLDQEELKSMLAQAIKFSGERD